MPKPQSHHRESPSRAAESLLSRLGVQGPPISVESVAKQLGLEVEKTALGGDISGILVVQDGKGIIGVNIAHATTRQRFTIAHEIGHFLLHQDKMPVFIDKQFLKPYVAAFRDSESSKGELRLEREANAFAASLLMPADAVVSAVSQLNSDLADDSAVEELAALFHVSRQSMSFRLANLESTLRW